MTSQNTIVHSNPWFSVSHRQDAETTDGAGWFRVHRPDSAIIVPVLPDGQIILIKGTRDTVGLESFFEIPSGSISPGEAPEMAARRELLEETGYQAGSWSKVAEYVESPALSSSRCIIYEARLLEKFQQSLEPGEDWLPVSCTLEYVHELCALGRMVDGSTLAALYLWERWAKK